MKIIFKKVPKNSKKNTSISIKNETDSNSSSRQDIDKQLKRKNVKREIDQIIGKKHGNRELIPNNMNLLKEEDNILYHSFSLLQMRNLDSATALLLMKALFKYIKPKLSHNLYVNYS